MKIVHKIQPIDRNKGRVSGAVEFVGLEGFQDYFIFYFCWDRNSSRAAVTAQVMELLNPL